MVKDTPEIAQEGNLKGHYLVENKRGKLGTRRGPELRFPYWNYNSQEYKSHYTDPGRSVVHVDNSSTLSYSCKLQKRPLTKRTN
jgi:hypothetical protein